MQARVVDRRPWKLKENETDRIGPAAYQPRRTTGIYRIAGGTRQLAPAGHRARARGQVEHARTSSARHASPPSAARRREGINGRRNVQIGAPRRRAVRSRPPPDAIGWSCKRGTWPNRIFPRPPTARSGQPVVLLVSLSSTTGVAWTTKLLAW
jgi:hypothetical protein